MLVGAIAALLYWQWARVVSWATMVWTMGVSWAIGVWTSLLSWVGDIIESTLGLFGWGLIFILIAIGALAIWLGRRRLSSFLYHGNRWLGSIALILAIWGILGFLNLGGSIGQGIIGETFLIGILRIMGLVLLGFILVTPKACFHLVAKSFSWIGGRLKRQPAQQEELL